MSCVFVVTDPHAVADGLVTWEGEPSHRVLICRTGDPAALVPATKIRGMSAIIVLAHEKARRAVRHAATVAQGARPTLPVITVFHNHHALAAAACAAVLAQAEGTPAQIAALVPAVMNSQFDAFIIKSVSRLNHPGVKVVHHLKSWIPGHKPFVATLGQNPTVSEINRVRLPRTGGQTLVTEGPMANHLQGLLPEAPVVVPPVVDPKQAYNHPASEFTIFGQLPTSHPQFGHCPSCQSVLPGPICPQCHVKTLRKEHA